MLNQTLPTSKMHIKVCTTTVSIIIFMFFRSLLSRMFNELIPLLQFVVNHNPQCTTVNKVSIDVENNSHYCVYSFIKTDIIGPTLQEAYHKAFPHVGNNWRVVMANLETTLMLMQQATWLYCDQQQQLCRRPNITHHADLVISLVFRRDH